MDLLSEDLIVLDADVKTAEDCLRYAADIFFKRGYVTEAYAEALVAREKVYPTGLPGKGINIAIPHTNNTYVNKPAVGVILPRQPIEFTMMGTKDQKLSCELIFPLVIQDAHMQINLLKKMMKVINDPALLKAIKNAVDKKEIMGYLNSLIVE